MTINDLFNFNDSLLDFPERIWNKIKKKWKKIFNKPDVSSLSSDNDFKGLVKATKYKKDVSIREDAFYYLNRNLKLTDFKQPIS